MFATDNIDGTIWRVERLDCEEYPGGYCWQVTTCHDNHAYWLVRVVDHNGEVLDVIGQYLTKADAMAQ